MIIAMVDKLRQRRSHRQSPAEATGAEPDRDAPVAFAEILAAASYLDFGGLSLEFWPGYRHITRDCDDR